jgi:hypothetical protein
MKTQKRVFAKMASLLTIFLMVISFNTNAQTHKSSSKMKHSSMMTDGCMMHNGKMMVMKNGITMPMEKDMVMKNGTTCMTTGECKVKDGKSMMMKEGDCMDINGKMCTDKMKNMSTAMYSCPMHPEVTSAKSGKCPKCGMALVKKS